MSLNSQVLPSSHGGAGKIKHFSLRGEDRDDDSEFFPRVFFEAKIDLCDIRSGFRETCSISKAFEIYPIDEDTLWTQDMVCDVDPDGVEPGAPVAGRMHALPPFVDTEFLARMEGQFFSYLMRYHAVRAYRNFALNCYSAPGESLEEFQLRCMEMLGESFRSDLDALHEVFQRRLEQVREKCLKDSEYLINSPDFEAVKSVAHWKSKIHDMSESLADLFLRTELRLELESAVQTPPSVGSMELDERLQSLGREARQQLFHLLDQYRDKVRNIDEYTIHPNMKDIHLVRSSILWVQEHFPK